MINTMQKKVIKAIIPAAGVGTRLLPITLAIPKEMLPVAGKPVIQYVVEEAIESGIEEILIVINKNKEAIKNHFFPPKEVISFLKKKNKLSEIDSILAIQKRAKISFTIQKEQKGLGHAIYQGKKFAGKDPFVVLLGDVIIKSKKKLILKEMINISKKYNKSVVAAEYLQDINNVEKYGIIKIDKKTKIGDKGIFKVADLIEKPSRKDAPSRLAIASRYVFSVEIFDLISKTKPGKNSEIQITDSMQNLAKDNKLLAYQFEGKRYDIGSKLDFIKANIEL